MSEAKPVCRTCGHNIVANEGDECQNCKNAKALIKKVPKIVKLPPKKKK